MSTGDDREVHLVRRSSVYRLASLGVRSRRGVHSLVLEHPPWRGLQVADVHRRIRRRSRRDARFAGRAGQRRRGHLLPEHDRGAEPARLPAQLESPRHRPDDGRRAPRQPSSVVAGRKRAATSSAGPRARSASTTSRRRSTQAPRPKLLDGHRSRPTSRGGYLRSQQIIAAAHERGVPVVVDGAQLAPHRPLPPDADFIAFSGHKMYAPFGSGVLIGPRAAFAEGDPFLAGGGAVDLVDLDEVVWTEPPDREEAGSPNVVGAVALHAAVAFSRISAGRR